MGKCIAPLVKYIQNKYQPIVVVHPLSEPIFKKYKISYHLLSDFFNTLLSKNIDIKSFLVKNRISHVFCTLSSPYLNLINPNLIKTSREIHIPTFGIMDHWKGYDRFFDDKGVMAYFPDFIGCIDEFCKNKLLELCGDPERIFIIGHPHLEKILNMKIGHLERKGKGVNILIISQPDTVDKSFQGIFFKRLGSEKVLDKVLKQINTIKHDIDINIRYRPHPKEKPFEQLPEGIDIEKTKDWENTLSENDIFIGLDSMLLIEAHLAGRYCFSLKIPDLSNFDSVTIPYQIGKSINHLDTLGFTLKEAISRLKQGCPSSPSDLKKKVIGSLQRSIYYFEWFVNKKHMQGGGNVKCLMGFSGFPKRSL